MSTRANWYRRYPADEIVRDTGLSLEQRGACILVADLMHARGGAIPDDAVWLSRLAGVSVRKWRSIRSRLIDSGRFAERDGMLFCTAEMERIEAVKSLSKKRSESGRNGGRRPSGKNAKTARKSPENGAASNKNNSLAKAKRKQTVSVNRNQVKNTRKSSENDADVNDFNNLTKANGKQNVNPVNCAKMGQNGPKTTRKCAENDAAPNEINDLAKAKSQRARAHANTLSTDSVSEVNLLDIFQKEKKNPLRGEKEKKKVGCRLPDDFALTDAMIAFAEKTGVDPQWEFESFCDYWRGVPGQRGVKLDWIATWRNWCRKASESAPARNRAAGHLPKTFAQQEQEERVRNLKALDSIAEKLQSLSHDGKTEPEQLKLVKG